MRWKTHQSVPQQKTGRGRLTNQVTKRTFVNMANEGQAFLMCVDEADGDFDQMKWDYVQDEHVIIIKTEQKFRDETKKRKKEQAVNGQNSTLVLQQAPALQVGGGDGTHAPLPVNGLNPQTLLPQLDDQQTLGNGLNPVILLQQLNELVKGQGELMKKYEEQQRRLQEKDEQIDTLHWDFAMLNKNFATLLEQFQEIDIRGTSSESTSNK